MQQDSQNWLESSGPHGTTTSVLTEDPWNRCAELETVPIELAEDVLQQEVISESAELAFGTVVPRRADASESVFRRWRAGRAQTFETSPFRHDVLNLGRATPFEDLLTIVRFALDRENGDALASRLQELHSDLAEDEDASELSNQSVIGLINFLTENPQISDPNLTASISGSIRAEWHQSWSQHFVIEFQTDTEARFVIFLPDPVRPWETVRLSGSCAVSSVMAQARPHGVEDWMVRG